MGRNGEAVMTYRERITTDHKTAARVQDVWRILAALHELRRLAR